MEKAERTDIIIVGQGVAGLVMSLLLSREGIDHILLGRTEESRPALAETLPPSALKLLQDADMLELFEACSSRTRGYHSLWGTPHVTDTHFFSHRPYNYGLKLDKQQLLQRLEEEAAKNIIICDSLVGVKPGKNEGTCLTYRQGRQVKELYGRYVIDATGRQRAVLKKIGIASVVADHQVAFSCHLPRVKHPQLKYGVFTESFYDGWGIVSCLDESTNVMTLFTDRDSELRYPIKHYDQWIHLLSSTRHLKEFLCSEPLSRVWGHEANSSKAAHISGPFHLAIGDAAIAMDPLSSHGISNALYTAQVAARVVVRALLHQSASEVTEYGQTLNRVFSQYLQHRNRLHNMAVSIF